jgi:hypothetical protein
MDLKMGLALLQWPHQGMANIEKVASFAPLNPSDTVNSRWIPPGPNQLLDSGT